MIAIYLDAGDNSNGNLRWNGRYIYPESDLISAMESLRAKEYTVSAFQEGDGLTFSHPTFDNQQMLDDLRSALLGVDIYRKDECEQDEFRDVLEDTVLVVIPIPRLKLDEPFLSKKNNIYPAGYFNTDDFELYNFNGTKFADYSENISWPNLNDPLNHITGIKTEDYQNMTTLVFKLRLCTHESFIAQGHQQITNLLMTVVDKTNLLLDHLKYQYNNYNLIDDVPGRPGLINSFSSCILHFVGVNRSHMINRQIEGKVINSGIGLYIDNLDVFFDNPLFYDDHGEVGNILKYALRLHTAIIETNDLSLKFTQIMTLFEYLADPYGYLAAKRVKGKIAVFCSRNRTEYTNFCERYRLFSESYRTSIIHLGQRIEDIIVDPFELERLFKELHRYILNVLNSMFRDMFLSWAEFAQKRDARQIELAP